MSDYELSFRIKGAFCFMCGLYSGWKREKQPDTYLPLTERHFFDAITAPSLWTEQVISSDPVKQAGKISLFMRELFLTTEPVCRPFWLLPNQVKLKSWSHFLVQVNTQVKVRFSPPGPHCEITVSTNIRGDVLIAVKHTPCGTVYVLFWHSFNTNRRGCVVWFCSTPFSNQWNLNTGSPQHSECSL